ncbi:DmX-like protein 2 [Phytophthora ramorum]|uniref:DmX-like protein 2 n=1 Tax=Phytophthora ramorum TaxID=164328 RepID=UPI0030ADF05D|nr:DmX-like protein 2 [Phytophthora ramorum]
MQWDDIRPLWLGLWIKDVKDLRGIVERFAKVSYARTKDAMDVCLLYVALGKKKVLSALAKLAQSDSNKTLASFLENDFSDKRWSNAAIRNAYSLLSKKKYEAAAAFFLVCEPPRIQDAIRVLAVRLGDPSLALVIARIVEYNADDKLQHDFTTSQAGITPVGDITKQLLEQDVIPLFRRKCEVWLESCALWWLEEFEHAWAVLLPQFQDVDVWGDNEFQVDRNYVYEAALAVMHPHAYLHIVEVCFLLSELGRVSALRKWVEYVSLSMMHSCSTFASCCIAEDVYRDWEGLTIQLCYILNLDAHCQISIPAQVIAHISVAVRTGIIFLGWARQRTDIVRQAVSLPFYTYGTINVPSTAEPGPPLSSFAFEKNLRLLCRLLQRPTANASELRKTRIFEGNLGYTFLGTVAARQVSDDNISLLSWGGIENAASQNQFKIRKMYTLILMVSVLRTLYARATVFLSTYQDGIDADDEGAVEADISSSLFTPQKLWKALGEGPLEGLKRWYALIESHLRCEFDYSVKEVPCLCGLYGLDNAAFEEAAAANVDWKEAKRQEDSSDNTSINDGDDDDAPAVDREGGKENDVTVTAPVGSVDTTEDESPDSLLAFLHEVGMSVEQHTALVNASDDYVLLLMQNADIGVCTTLRRFRMDPRVYVKSFVLRDAFNWFARHQIFSSDSKTDIIAQIHAFLSRCCQQRKLRLLSCRVASRLWNAEIDDQNHAAVKALEKLLPSVFSGPPAMLRCAMYQKNKVLSHQFMGRAKVPLDELTSGNPMDCWLPLEDTTRGSLHVKISLSFQLMCSSMAGQPNSKDLR